eukprot:CAMPEP_0116541118 /NCGR_PEP_ID=MMETSP0397-20121206/313_1 /TAXON_ID=216820 /ORGANISM="Cyclophora tenuis, Strain ECT3854" /LENGTH=139 /DNA_ID=CAMNT_0004065041 /DNA_START=219 /DNA_END=634 /DNA_ORIENTATION=+
MNIPPIKTINPHTKLCVGRSTPDANRLAFSDALPATVGCFVDAPKSDGVCKPSTPKEGTLLGRELSAFVPEEALPPLEGDVELSWYALGNIEGPAASVGGTVMSPTPLDGFTGPVGVGNTPDGLSAEGNSIVGVGTTSP